MDTKQLTPKMHGVEEKGPHRIDNDELYRRSTQYRYWSFDEEKIEDLRIKVNKRGQEIFNNRILKLDDEIIKKFLNNEKNFKNITVNEERLIIIYYARKCKDLSNFFKFKTQVRLTAISYLFKFYLIHSIMEYYPQQIMYTCLYLSAKSENNFIGINNFSKAIPKTTPESILKFEYLILDSMRFSLMCHHSIKPLYGFYLDIQNVLIKLDFNRLYKDYLLCRDLINESIFNDIQFLFTPPQIALASLYIIDDVVCMRYLMRKFGVKRKQMIIKMNQLKNNEKEDIKIKKDIIIKEEIKDSTNDIDNDDNIDDDDGGSSNDEKSKKEKKQTPIERYEKMIEIIKACAIKMKENINPTVEEAKIISLKAHFCLDPVKYFKKISRDVTPINVNTDNTDNNSVKRENTDDDINDDIKRIKVE
ncbi:hypothetical protein C6P40_004026 [Pichia californica]|uniref:Cyclin-like domain-containing protein n=1 Tax=Pichia californica TaxID=460514 RepID=A0A9P6WQ71_9ASCO|nr:hypothetical protein C6P42_002436 [[Candida] californica]KAG0691214.1 hypothetical protein C6P40_004026 [[Candida] californica]